MTRYITHISLAPAASMGQLTLGPDGHTAALNTKGPINTLATYGNIGQLLTTAPTIDTRIELQVQFTDTINPDPTQPYLIGSRRYACARLEITIDQNGIQPLKQAYLYEIQ